MICVLRITFSTVPVIQSIGPALRVETGMNRPRPRDAIMEIVACGKQAVSGIGAFESPFLSMVPSCVVDTLVTLLAATGNDPV